MYIIRIVPQKDVDVVATGCTERIHKNTDWAHDCVLHVWKTPTLPHCGTTT